MSKNDSIAKVASASEQVHPTSQLQTSSGSFSSVSVRDSTASSLPWILQHILENNTANELPLRIMFSFNAGQRLPTLKEVNQIYQYDARGRKVIEFIASLPQDDLESGDGALNQFMGENHEFFFGGDNNTKLAPLEGFPIHFVKSMCQRVFITEYKQVDFDQALACLDYLRDLECSRRAALRDAALRLNISEYSWKSVLTDEPEAYGWVSKVQQQELTIESLYATVFVDLRIWTMIHELQSDPFYKPNVLAMLNTLFPLGLKHMPNDKVDVERLTKYRTTFYKHIRAVDANGSGIIAEFVEKLMNPSTKHSWPETRRQLEEYLNLADAMIKEAKSVDGMEYFHETSSVTHSRTTSNAQSAASDRPYTASSANTNYDGRPYSNSSSKSPTTAFDDSTGKPAPRRRGSNLFEADSFFEIPPLPSSAPVDPTKTPYATPRERAASTTTNSHTARSSSPHQDGRARPRTGGLSIKIPAAVPAVYGKYSPAHRSPLVEGDMAAHKRSESDCEGTSADPLQPTSASKHGIFHGGFDFLNHPFQPGHTSTEVPAPKLKQRKSLTDIILRRKSSFADLPEPTPHAINSSERDAITEHNRVRKLKSWSNLQKTKSSSTTTERMISTTHSDLRSLLRATKQFVPTADERSPSREARPPALTTDLPASEVGVLSSSATDDMGLGKIIGKLGKKVKHRKNHMAEKLARTDGDRIMADRVHKQTSELSGPPSKPISEEEAALNARKRAYLLGDHPRYGVPIAGPPGSMAAPSTILPENPYQLTSSEEYNHTQKHLTDLGFALLDHTATHPITRDPDAEPDQHITDPNGLLGVVNPDAKPRSSAAPHPLNIKKSAFKAHKGKNKDKDKDFQSTLRPHEDKPSLTAESKTPTQSHQGKNPQSSDSQSPNKFHDDKDFSVQVSTSRRGRSPTARTQDSQSRKSSSPSTELNPELTYDSIGRRPDSSLIFDHGYYREMVEIAKKRLALRYAANPEQAYEDYRADFIETRRNEREKEAKAARAEEEAELAARLKAVKAEEAELKQQEIYRGMDEEAREAWNELAILEGIKPRDAEGKTIEDYVMPKPEVRYVLPTPEELAAARKEREKPRLLVVLKRMLRKNIEVFEDEWDALFEEFGMTCEEVNVFARESGLIDENGEEVVRGDSEEDSDLDDTNLEATKLEDTELDDYEEVEAPNHASSLDYAARGFERRAQKIGLTEGEFEPFYKDIGWVEDSEVGEHDESSGTGTLENEEVREGGSVISDGVVSSQAGSLDTRTKELQNIFEESGMTMEEFTEWLQENDMLDDDELDDHEESDEDSVISTTPYSTDSTNTRVKKLKKLFRESGMTWEEFTQWLRENDMVEEDDEEEASEAEEHEDGSPTSAAGTVDAGTEEWPVFVDRGMTAKEMAQNARDKGLFHAHRVGDGEYQDYEKGQMRRGQMRPEEIRKWAHENTMLEVEEQEGSVSSCGASQACSLDTGTRDLFWYENGEMSGWIGFAKMRGPPGLIPIGGRKKAHSI